MKKYAILALSAGFAFATDQASKYYITDVLAMPLRTQTPVIPPYLNWKHVPNPGINFGLMSAESDMGRWILVAVALLVCGAVLFWVRDRLWHKASAISAGLLVGGALGNVWDRINLGYVTDFINNSLPFWTNPFSYNLADVWVFIGIIGLIFLEPKSEKARSK